MVFSRVSELATPGFWRDWNQEDTLVPSQSSETSKFALASLSHSSLNSPAKPHPYFGDFYSSLIRGSGNQSLSQNKAELRKRFESAEEANRIRVINETRPSVVSIFVKGPYTTPQGQTIDTYWLGSGFVISPKDLGLKGYRLPPGHSLVMTNLHVAQDAKSIDIEAADGNTYMAGAKPLVIDEVHDVAVLVVNTEGKRLKPIQIGDRSDVSQGDDVITFGQPHGLDFSVSEGIVSAMRDEEELNAIQTTAAINPGNSGGPLIHLGTGKVIGMNSFIFQDSDNLGFAMAIWDQLHALRTNWEFKTSPKLRDLPEAQDEPEGLLEKLFK